MSMFAVAFRDHVTPRLARTARWQGYLVVLGDTSFQAAYDAVLAQAMFYGALRLPEPLLVDLEDWIDRQILDAMIEFEPSVLASCEVADRVAADIAQWGAGCQVAT